MHVCEIFLLQNRDMSNIWVSLLEIYEVPCCSSHVNLCFIQFFPQVARAFFAWQLYLCSASKSKIGFLLKLGGTKSQSWRPFAWPWESKPLPVFKFSWFASNGILSHLTDLVPCACPRGLVCSRPDGHHDACCRHRSHPRRRRRRRHLGEAARRRRRRGKNNQQNHWRASVSSCRSGRFGDIFIIFFSSISLSFSFVFLEENIILMRGCFGPSSGWDIVLCFGLFGCGFVGVGLGCGFRLGIWVPWGWAHRTTGYKKRPLVAC